MKVGVLSPLFARCLLFLPICCQFLTIFVDFRQIWDEFWPISVIFCLFLSVFVALIQIGSLSVSNDFKRFTTMLC